jgi:hypothetical protein
LVDGEISGLANPTTDPFTMSGYVSFITEFGLVMLLFLVVLVLGRALADYNLNRYMLCWLILTAYLYVQFEGYAFYALPLLVLGRSTLTQVIERSRV